MGVAYSSLIRAIYPGNRMTAQAALSQNSKIRRKTRGFLLLPFALFGTPLVAAGFFVAYALWPTWPSTPVALDAPSLPITVAGTLFEVPPAAIRAAVQRHPGPQQRIDLVFLWPSLTPPQPETSGDSKSLAALEDGASARADVSAAPTSTSGRLFVTIAPLESLLPPLDRLRDVYPRYVEAQATAAAEGLAIAPFRAGSPYDGEDLIYLANKPERFFTLCTRDTGVLPGTCIHEQMLGDADIALRFPRDWLKDWKSVADGFDRLMAQLHPQGT
jgi:hypothetical protein